MAAVPVPAAPATPAAFYKMISIPEAQETVLQHTSVLPSETLPLSQLLGRVLAEDVKSSEPLPPFPASIKDGYAVLAADGPKEYEVAFEALAGTEQQTLTPGTIAYIGTGGPVPHGADAVVQIEDTQVVGRTALGTPVVDIKKAARPGQDIRTVGSDIQAGQTVLAAGERIGPAEIGLLATVGAAQAKVHKVPHVAVLSTGDEIAQPGTLQLAPGAIRDANRPMLLAAAAEAGATTMDLGIVPDSAGVAGLEAALSTALDAGADVLLTSGGVSMGDKDFVKPLLERHATVHFGKVRMKPGKPLTFATLNTPDGRQVLVFGLPGNPVSSLVTFNLVVLPALRKAAGWKDPHLRRVHASLAAPQKLDPVRPEYHRAALRWAPPSPQKPTRATPSAAAGQQAAAGKENEDGLAEVDLGPYGGWVAESTGGQISSRLLSMRSATALLEFPQVGLPPLPNYAAAEPPDPAECSTVSSQPPWQSPAADAQPCFEPYNSAGEPQLSACHSSASQGPRSPSGAYNAAQRNSPGRCCTDGFTAAGGGAASTARGSGSRAQRRLSWSAGPQYRHQPPAAWRSAAEPSSNPCSPDRAACSSADGWPDSSTSDVVAGLPAILPMPGFHRAEQQQCSWSGSLLLLSVVQRLLSRII